MAIVRGLSALLAALFLVAAACAAPPPAPDGGSPAAGGRTTRAAAAEAATAPPDPGDVTRNHSDPGVWPELVLIFGLFLFGVVVRNSRSRRQRTGTAADRRRP
jgi:hypothetical protein